MTTQVKPQQSQFVKDLREILSPMLALVLLYAVIWILAPTFRSTAAFANIFENAVHPVHHVYGHDHCVDWRLPGSISGFHICFGFSRCWSVIGQSCTDTICHSGRTVHRCVMWSGQWIGCYPDRYSNLNCYSGYPTNIPRNSQSGRGGHRDELLWAFL